MKNSFKAASLCTMALALSACGGSSTEATSPNVMLSTRAAVTPSATRAPAEYKDIVQRMYMAFFGRPADALGLQFWEAHFSEKNMPLTISELNAAYSTNQTVKEIVDIFADSTESQNLYTGNNSAFINAVYLNVFNRNAESAGREFWGAFLDSGVFTRGQAVLRILDAAQNDDAIILGKKVQSAISFTDLLDTEIEFLSYDGNSANEGARELLGTINRDTDVAAFVREIEAYIALISSSDSNLPVVSYYSGFNYLQNMTATPQYMARYRYSSGGLIGPSPTGTVTLGETPDRFNWTRLSSTSFSYDAPFTDNASLPGLDRLLPSVAMLCRTVPVAEGTSLGTLRATDVLVSRSIKQLTDASQLAGQTLSVYRENCGTTADGGSFVFDAAGNGTRTSASGSVTFDAATISAALNGRVLQGNPVTQSLLFNAYSYDRRDRTTGYAIVERQSVPGTVLSHGALALWSQE